MRPRRSVNVAALVANPEDTTSRPIIRLRVVGVVVLVLFAVMILRLWSLQVINHTNYDKVVTAVQIRQVPIAAPRGEIVDRNATVLVGNIPEQEITVSQVTATQYPQVIGELAALLGQTPAQVHATVFNLQYSPYQPVPVIDSAPMSTIEYLQQHANLFPGVSVQLVTQRQYPQGGSTAAQVLGYTGDITSAELAASPGVGYTQQSQVGQSGVEYQYEKYLRGEPGIDDLSVNVSGQVVGTTTVKRPQTGDTVVLNINLGLQTALENALASQIMVDRQTPDPVSHVIPAATNGAAIVLDPQNGQVLAMASYPTYDLNEWVGGISAADYAAIAASGAENNYAIEGQYTPGSTFKLVTATAALQDNLISPTQYVNDTGVFTVPGCNTADAAAGCSFKDDEASDAGEVDLPSAISKSDDYYFYNLGYLFWQDRATYGDTPIQNVAADYGLGKLTGIDLPGEVTGRVDSPAVRQQLHAADPSAFPNDTWYTGDNIEMAFGQGGTVLTPIGQATAYATFANGGTKYAPEVASEIVNPTTGAVVDKIAPKVTGHVNLPASIYQPILTGLEGVINSPEGTGNAPFNQYAKFAYNSFPLAGKTGTASNAGNEEPNSWFVAFGPEPNPQYLVLCVIDQGGYGADAAAPVVFNTFNYIVANPVGPVVTPTPAKPASTVTPPTNPPAGTPVPTTTPAGGSGTTTTTAAAG
jgi:penicillin-binding protein 2